MGTTWAKAAKIAPAAALIAALAACGTSGTSSTSVTQINGQLTAAQTTSLIDAVIGPELAQQGMSPQTFCTAMAILPSATITQDFMNGYNTTAGSGPAPDESAIAPAIQAWCSTNI